MLGIIIIDARLLFIFLLLEIDSPADRYLPLYVHSRAFAMPLSAGRASARQLKFNCYKKLVLEVSKCSKFERLFASLRLST